MNDAGPRRRYFDNAATSFPKPPGVVEAVRDYIEHNGASAGRGAYREAVDSGRLIEQCRAALRRLFGLSQRDHVVFTLNGSDALNLAIKGLVRPGDHVVTSVMDHNSVLRPLSALAEREGVTWTAVKVDPHTTRLAVDDVAAAIRPETRLVAINHASNVTGVLQPIEEIAGLCRARGVFLLVDAAQSAGHVPIDFGRTPIDLLATPGHKGLLGPLGTGVLLIRAGVEEHLRTVREGGTGSVSEQPVQPDFLPDKYEAGSHNAVGIAGLLAALRWLEQRTVAAQHAHEQTLCAEMIARLEALPAEILTWYGPRDAAQRVGVFSVRVGDFEPTELAAILESQFGLLTRPGLHCAPLAHETIGTHTNGGTTRFSLGPMLEQEDVVFACDALAEITRSATQPA